MLIKLFLQHRALHIGAWHFYKCIHLDICISANLAERTTRAKAISSDIFFFVYASLYRGLIIHQGFPFNILLELMPFIGDIIVALFGGKTIDDKRVETV